MDSPHNVTRLLLDLKRGNAAAFERLMPIVYSELHSIARGYIHKERSDLTLQATGLVHEAYLKLVGNEHIDWKGRAHFFRAAAQAMRRILVDYARARNAAKRDPGQRVTLSDDAAVADCPGGVDVVALDRALNGLAQLDPRKSSLVELRYFGGLTLEDTAKALGISLATVKRDWVMAKAWLYNELASEN